MGDDQGRVGDLSLDRCPAGGGFGAYRSSAQMTPAIGTPGWSIVMGCVATQAQYARARVREAQAGEAQRSGRRVSSRRLYTSRLPGAAPLERRATRPAVSSAASGMPCAHNRRDQPPRRIGRPLPIAASTNPAADVQVSGVAGATSVCVKSSPLDSKSRRGAVGRRRFRSACHAASAASCEVAADRWTAGERRASRAASSLLVIGIARLQVMCQRQASVAALRASISSGVSWKASAWALAVACSRFLARGMGRTVSFSTSQRRAT